MTVPNPGSDTAVDQGCICPVLDNGHGLNGPPFWVRSGCPLHAPAWTATTINDRPPAANLSRVRAAGGQGETIADE